VGIRVLVSEIRLAAEPGQESSARALAQRLRREIETEADFAAAARTNSAGPTAGAGGRLDWMSLSDLPAEVATQMLGLRPGQTSNPISVEGAVVIYFLRDLQQTGPQSAQATSVEYARLALPAGRDPAEEAARIRTRLDTCDDLYGVATGASETALLRETRSVGELPADLALALAALDDNETALYVAAGQPSLVMLCGRVPVFEDAPNREIVRRDLLNRRLAAYADGYLEELRADAIIREP
jgi:peptidyl-prolyl cis-trans isomerase SurA